MAPNHSSDTYLIGNGGEGDDGAATAEDGLLPWRRLPRPPRHRRPVPPLRHRLAPLPIPNPNPQTQTQTPNPNPNPSPPIQASTDSSDSSPPKPKP
ncbi:hypothetical protein Sjap_026512 [Stephania japonica]|uniref:Uncharacterized protein n=1 Tax=Stephania japonica TaxID=461633 RepID=A0AAP0HIY8_9MAGN